jgi:hypothetical protein
MTCSMWRDTMPHHLDVVVLRIVVEAVGVVWAPVAQANVHQRQIGTATVLVVSRSDAMQSEQYCSQGCNSSE